jgi:indole-3-glycerol phosphate synthase
MSTDAKLQAPDLLAAIVAATRTRVEHARSREPLAALERRAAPCTPRGEEFFRALNRRDTWNVVAECKRRSPSRGVLRAAYDAVEIARGYEAAGAAAISVLTEPTFFDGTLEHLEAIRSTVQLPLLRKDFVVDPYQIVESVAAGADAVLLIVAALDDDSLRRLLADAADRGLSAVVEAHTEDEFVRAVTAGARIVGVNNRSLRTLTVDVGLSERLARLLSHSEVPVAESGLRTPDDLERLRALGYRAFLIGERFMTTPDPGEALAGLLSEVKR